MSGFPSYLRKTLLGGILVALPVVLFANVLVWMVEWIGNQSTPVATVLADWFESPLWVGKTLAILATLALCFMLGAFVSNRFGGRVFNWFESRTLGRLPGYGAIKEVVGYFGKNDRNPFARPVVVNIGEGMRFFGFLSDEREDECTVFIPTGPNPTTGLIVHVPNAQVERLGAPGTDVAKTIIACGAGSAAILATRRRP
jgi:uncharacterized membrane protein